MPLGPRSVDVGAPLQADLPEPAGDVVPAAPVGARVMELLTLHAPSPRAGPVERADQPLVASDLGFAVLGEQQREVAVGMRPVLERGVLIRRRHAASPRRPPRSTCPTAG